MRDMYPNNLPTSDFPEIVYRLKQVKNDLEEVTDDWERQEIYDRISMSAIIVGDVIDDLGFIEGVLRAVVDA